MDAHFLSRRERNENRRERDEGRYGRLLQIGEIVPRVLERYELDAASGALRTFDAHQVGLAECSPISTTSLATPDGLPYQLEGRGV